MQGRIWGFALFSGTCVLVGFIAGAIFSGAGLKPVPALQRAQAWLGYAFEHRSDSYILAGRETFENSCGVCHGVTENEAVRLAHSTFNSYKMIGAFRVIAHGDGNGDMPAFTKRLSDRKMLQTVAYLESLRDREVPKIAAQTLLPDGAYEYVAITGGLLIYSIDNNFELVRNIRVPGLAGPRGIAIDAASGRLYVSFHGDQSEEKPVGRVTAIDLNTEQEVWRRDVRPGIDSLAITPDGRKIYIPAGEHLDGETAWAVLDAETGALTGKIPFGRAGHNTQVSADGRWAYLASIGYDHMGIVDTATDKVVAEIGPFGNVLRPFALTGDGRFALVNVNGLSGFEVADLEKREVIHRVQVEGWPWKNPHPSRSQSHGIALTPDEREAWVSDSWNHRMHVFDISGLPAKPVQGADILLTGQPKWMRFTHDGAWMHVSTGEIVDAKTHQVVRRLAPSRYYVEAAWKDGKLAAGYSRYGNGYLKK